MVTTRGDAARGAQREDDDGRQSTSPRVSNQDQVESLTRQLEQLQARVDTLSRASEEAAITPVPGENAMALAVRSGGYKLNQPPVFTGTSRGELADDWLFQMEQFQAAGRIPAEDRVMVAATFLRGAAATWWHRRVRRVETGVMEPITTFTQFAEGIKAAFMRHDHEAAVRDELAKCEQRGSVRDYVTRLRALELHLSDFPDKELLAVFKRGLKPAIKRHVVFADPATFDEAVRVAERMDEVERSDPHPSRSRTHNSQPITLSAMYPARNQSRSQRNHRAPRMGPSRPENKGVDRSQLQCWNCNRFGHFASECPSRRPGNGRRQQQ